MADDLDNADALSGREMMAKRLQEALRSRAVVDQALGVVMERENLSPEAAFTMLQQVSQRVNAKIIDIVTGIVASGWWKKPGQ